LFDCSFEIVDDPLGENVGIGEAVEFFEAFISESEDIETGVPPLSSEVYKFRMSPLLSRTAAYTRIARVKTWAR
jgi:hypothetical protein